MAPKRHSALEDPPSATYSSSEEDEESEGVAEEEEEEEEEEERNDTVEEEGNSEEEEEEAEEGEKPSEKKSTGTSATSSQPHAHAGSDSDSDTDPETGSDSDHNLPSPSASDFTIKPIVSKPMNGDHTKPKKAEPKPGSKRRPDPEPNEKESRTKKKPKASNGDEEDPTVEETGKKGSGANQRLWSVEDEIVILKGMIDYTSKKGADPLVDAVAFHEFIKKSLHVDVSKNQLMDKIRRLRKKYQNNTEKGENGEDPVFSKPHEFKSFELSKKIWAAAAASSGGGKNVVDHVTSKRKSRNNNNNANTVLALPKQDVNSKPENASNGELKSEKTEEFGPLHPNMNEAVESGQFCDLSVMELGKGFLKERLSLIGNLKAKELEEKWRKLKVNEIEVYLKRVELIEEQTKLVLDAMKSSMS